MSISTGKAKEIIFQDEMIAHMVAAGWQLEVEFGASDPNSEGLLGEKFTEGQCICEHHL